MLARNKGILNNHLTDEAFVRQLATYEEDEFNKHAILRALCVHGIEPNAR